MREPGTGGCGPVGTLLLALAVCLAAADRSAARTLEEALASGFPGVLREDGEAFAGVFARTVAASFPVTGTSSAYVYRFDPASDSFQRLNIPLGPVFSERGATVGPRSLSLALNYVLIQYDTINGRSLDALASNDPNTGADHIAICAGPLRCEPVLGVARVDLEAQIVTVSATYGVTPDLDINLLLPLVRTSLRATTTFTGPDPRMPASPGYFPLHFTTSTSEASTGVGDLLLRLKYVIRRDAPADIAAGLTLSLPTGARADFQGTGDTIAGAAVYVSRTYAERVEPHLNLAFVLDADKLDRSQARYSAGADLRVLDWLTLNADFLGRSNTVRPDSIDRPVFLQIERADVLQFSTGLKVSPLQRTAVFFNALLPLNEAGLRSDCVLAFGVEGVF
jgi:Putative MetA-pathway of phenol degradation